MSSAPPPIPARRPDSAEPHTALDFVKLEGCGNDYLFVDGDALPVDLAERFELDVPRNAPRLCHRHYGVGADGLVLFRRIGPAGQLRMLMWNADGSRGSLCGNAVRCLVKLVGDSEAGELDEFLVETDAAAHRVLVHRENHRIVWCEVEIGPPRFEPEQIPLDLTQLEAAPAEIQNALSIRLPALGETWEGLVLSIGNPHLVIPLKAPPTQLPVPELGAALQAHPAFPEGVNVAFAHLDSAGRITSRTCERGSGETLACGSSACAIAVAFASLGVVPEGHELPIHQPGGTLIARWDGQSALWLAGPAREAFRGRCAWAPAEAPGQTAAGSSS